MNQFLVATPGFALVAASFLALFAAMGLNSLLPEEREGEHSASGTWFGRALQFVVYLGIAGIVVGTIWHFVEVL